MAPLDVPLACRGPISSASVIGLAPVLLVDAGQTVLALRSIVESGEPMTVVGPRPDIVYIGSREVDAR